MCIVVKLKPADVDDAAFLFDVYASTRADEMALVKWDDEQKRDFLRMQFDAQQKYYRERFPDTAFQVVLSGDRGVGRLYLYRSTRELHILDIALLPEYRNSGIGTTVLRELLAEASVTGKFVSIYVERANRALRLYERLGFVRAGASQLHYLLEWRGPPLRGSDVRTD